MKQQSKLSVKRVYSAPALDIITLDPALQLLGVSDADLVVDLHDEEENVYENEVW